MFSSGEYTNAYASPYSEYTHLSSYYKGSQFGPKLPASVPSNAYPTILKQGNEHGYEALTHDTDGNSYYNVEKAYGTSCQPKYYVAKCPENKFIRPFVPNAGNMDMGPPTPCPVKTEGIAEGYTMPPMLPTGMPSSGMPTMPPMLPTGMPSSGMPTRPPKLPTGMPSSGMPTRLPSPMPSLMNSSPLVGQLQHLKILFFYDKSCPHSRQAMDTYQKALYPTPIHKVFLSVRDVSQFNNEKLLTELGGTATPFFFSQTTNRSVTGHVALEALLSGLQGSSRESYQSSSGGSMASKVQSLQIVVFVMQGCVFCDKIKEMLAKEGLDKMVQFVNATDPQYRNELKNVRGFPHYKSMKTGKSSTGFPGSVAKMVANLE